MNKEFNEKLTKIVSGWVKLQVKTAKDMNLSPGGLNQMLTGVSAFPLSRFLQLIYYCNPSQNEIDQAFKLYLQALNLPEDSITLTLHGNRNQENLRKRIHEMVDQMSNEQLEKIEPLLHLILEK